LLAARANPAIRVYSFEPARGPLHYLKMNRFLNHLEHQVSIFAVALSNTSGNLEFLEIQNPLQHTHYNLGGAGKLLTEKDLGINRVSVLVPAETADVFFKALSPPDLIKMDTEGTENLILEGARELINTYKPIIICETLFGVIERELEEIMKAHGFGFYNFLDGRLVKTDSLLRQTDNGVSDCFFVHPEKEHLIREFI
jgi:FkbM family methyltransferase